MSSLIPQFRRPGVGTSLGNHEARIRALERQASGGDYVFLQETVLDVAADTLDFDDIAQGYQHLVLELLLKRQDIPDSAVYQAGFTWNGWYGYDWTHEIIPDDVQNQSADDGSVVMAGCIPSVDGGFNAQMFGMITAKFPFYSVPSVTKGCLWEGVLGTDEEAGFYYDAEYASGGGQSVYDPTGDDSNMFADPITSIQIIVPGGSPGVNQFSAGSRGQLYGIKKH